MDTICNQENEKATWGSKLCDPLIVLILEFILDESEYLSNFQLVCKKYEKNFKDRLYQVYWKKVEKIVRKKNADKMKQGSAFAGYLDLGGNQIFYYSSCEILTHPLAKMTALERLDLDGNRIDAKACEVLAPALAKMTALKRLDLNNNKIDAKACEVLAPALAKMTALENLSLHQNQIDAKACEVLAQVLPKMMALKALGLERNQLDAKAKEMMRDAWVNAGEVGRKWFNLYI